MKEDTPKETPKKEAAQAEAPNVNLQAAKVARDLLDYVQGGTCHLVMVVGVGPGGAYFRNVGGSGNAYEMMGLMDLQKKELLDELSRQSAAEQANKVPKVLPSGSGGSPEGES